MFSNKAYNVLKPVALILLPGLGALYFALAAIWNLPDGAQVTGSIAAINTFLGATLHISSAVYKPVTDGNLVIDKTDPVKDLYSFEVTSPISELETKDRITLKVLPPVTAGKPA